MGIQYTTTFADGRGREIRVELRQEGAPDAPSPIRLASTPLVRTVSKTDSPILEPLRPSVVRLRVHPDHADAVATMRASGDRWFIVAYVDGVEDVRGVWRPALLDASDDMIVTEATELVFNDGLGLLQDRPFLAEGDLQALPQSPSVLDLMMTCLSRMPSFLHLDVGVVSEWYTAAMIDGIVNFTPLDAEVVRPDRYITDDGSMTAYKVLADLLRGKGLFLTQANQQWHVRQRPLYATGAPFDQVVYRLSSFSSSAASTYVGIEEQTPYVAGLTDYSDRLKGSRIGERGAHAAVAVTYDHGAVQNALPALYPDELFLWTREFDRVAEYWIDSPDRPQTQASGPVVLPVGQFDEAETVREMLTTVEQDDGFGTITYDPPYETHTFPVRLEADGSGITTSIQARATVPINKSSSGATVLGYTQVILEADDGTTYYLKRQVASDERGYTYEDPVWETSEAWVAWQIEVPASAADAVGSTVTEADVEAPPLPDAGDVYVRLWGAINTEPAAFDDVQGFTYHMEGAGLATSTSDAEARTTTASVEIAPDVDALELTVLHGTGPSSAHRAATRFNGSLARDWGLGQSHTQELPADELLAREALRQLAERQQVYRRTFQRLDLMPTDAIEVDGALHLPVHLEKDYRRGTTQGEWVEVVQSDRSISTRLVFDDEGRAGGGGGSGNSGGGNSIGSGPSGPVDWDDIERRPEGLYSSTGQAETTLLDDVALVAILGYTPFDEAGGDILGSVEISGFLSVQGNTNIVGDLSVTDEFTAGLATVGGLDVQGATTLAGAVTAEDDVTVQGNLTVLGTEFIANTETVEISDNLAVINSGETGSGVTAGFAGWEVDRGTATDFRFGFDESLDRFVVGQQADTQVVATREDSPVEGGVGFYNTSTHRFETSSNLKWDSQTLNADEVAVASSLTIPIIAGAASGAAPDIGVTSWSELQGKPFERLGVDFTVTNGTLELDPGAIPDSAQWGNISGVLYDQSDLQSALNQKLDASAYTPVADVDAAGYTKYDTSDFNADFAGKSTSDLAEGSRLYFTDARARAALDGTNASLGNIDVNSIDAAGSIDAEGFVASYNQLILKDAEGDVRARLRTATRETTTNGVVELNVRDTDGINTGEVLRIDTEDGTGVDARLMQWRFSDLDANVFEATRVTATGRLTIPTISGAGSGGSPDIGVTSWSGLTDKPFETLGADFVVTSGALQIDPAAIPDTAQWGNISGALSDQSDLRGALGDKLDASAYTPIADVETAGLALADDLEVNAITRTRNVVVRNGSSVQWEAGNGALQRADARDDGSTKSRLHWFGRNDQGDAIAAVHRYFDGNNYVSLSASGGDLTTQGFRIWHDGNADAFARDALDNTIPSFDALDLANNEASTYNVDGRLIWDKSSGVYVRSSNANDGTSPRLLWSGDNVTTNSGIVVDYLNEDHPRIGLADNIDVLSIDVSGQVTAEDMLIKNGSGTAYLTFDRSANSFIDDVFNISAQGGGGGNLRIGTTDGIRTAQFFGNGDVQFESGKLAVGSFLGGSDIAVSLNPENNIKVQSTANSSYSFELRQRFNYANPFQLNVYGENLLTTERGANKSFLYAGGTKGLGLDADNQALALTLYGDTDVQGDLTADRIILPVINA